MWESGESTGRDVGGGEGKCLRVNVKSLAKCVRVWREVWRVWGEVLLQRQLCVIKVLNLRTYNGSHVFTTLRNHLAFLISTTRFTLHCRFIIS